MNDERGHNMIGREMRLLDIYMDGWMGYIKCVYMVPEMHGGMGIVPAKAAALQTSDERNIGQNNNTLHTSLLLLKER